MTLLGDFGGFNGTMIMITAYLMSYFSIIMYKRAITEEIPVRVKGQPASESSLKSKLLSTDGTVRD